MTQTLEPLVPTVAGRAENATLAALAPRALAFTAFLEIAVSGDDPHGLTLSRALHDLAASRFGSNRTIEALHRYGGNSAEIPHFGHDCRCENGGCPAPGGREALAGPRRFERHFELSVIVEVPPPDEWTEESAPISLLGTYVLSHEARVTLCGYAHPQREQRHRKKID